MTLAAWVHDLDPFLWRISGDFGVRWYGMSYIAGFICGWALLWWLSKRGRSLIPVDRVADVMLVLVFAVLIGGRLGYVLLYQPSLLWDLHAAAPWWGVLEIHKGGMASHGGMVGVLAGCMWMARKLKLPALHLLDVVALATPIGLLFGRLANFVNGELLGRIVAQPGEPAPRWAVRFPQELLLAQPPALTDEQSSQLAHLLDRVALPDEGYEPAVQRLIAAVQRGAVDFKAEIEPLLSARHPSQLYQAAAEGLLLMAVLWAVWARPRKPGVIAAWFLIAYGVMRIVTEFARLPDDHLATPLIFGLLSRGQVYSAVMVFAGAAMLWAVSRRDAPKLGGLRRPVTG